MATLKNLIRRFSDMNKRNSFQKTIDRGSLKTTGGPADFRRIAAMFSLSTASASPNGWNCGLLSCFHSIRLFCLSRLNTIVSADKAEIPKINPTRRHKFWNKGIGSIPFLFSSQLKKIDLFILIARLCIYKNSFDILFVFLWQSHKNNFCCDINSFISPNTPLHFNGFVKHFLFLMERVWARFVVIWTGADRWNRFSPDWTANYAELSIVAAPARMGRPTRRSRSGHCG